MKVWRQALQLQAIVRDRGKRLEALEEAVSIIAGTKSRCVGALPRRPAGMRDPVTEALIGRQRSPVRR
jgi:hypothetical protein